LRRHFETKHLDFNESIMESSENKISFSSSETESQRDIFKQSPDSSKLKHLE